MKCPFDKVLIYKFNRFAKEMAGSFKCIIRLDFWVGVEYTEKPKDLLFRGL